jgi:anti-sigma factor RsiW
MFGNDVDCQQVETLLSDYVDERLESTQKTAFDSHVSQCAPCLAFLRQYRFAPQAMRTHLLKCAPADLEAKVMSFLRTKKI